MPNWKLPTITFFLKGVSRCSSSFVAEGWGIPTDSSNFVATLTAFIAFHIFQFQHGAWENSREQAPPMQAQLAKSLVGLAAASGGGCGA